jgi:hypothetical protein
MSLLLTFMELDQLYEAVDRPDELSLNDYKILKHTYKTSTVFKDRNKESGRIAELLDKLNYKNIPYEQYIHRTDNGITIFHDKIM